MDNTFDFRNVPSGSYLLDVHCHTHTFAPLRVDVHEGGEDKKVEEVSVWGTFRGNEWGNKGEAVAVTEVEVEGKGKEKVWGFVVRALGIKEYLVERVGCERPPLTTAAHLICLWETMNKSDFGKEYLLTMCNSLTNEYTEEPNDPHCRLQYDCRLWNAISYG